MRSAGDRVAAAAGTQQPIWARMTAAHVARSRVLLPPMFGPVSSRARQEAPRLQALPKLCQGVACAWAESAAVAWPPSVSEHACGAACQRWHSTFLERPGRYANAMQHPPTLAAGGKHVAG